MTRDDTGFLEEIVGC